MNEQFKPGDVVWWGDEECGLTVTIVSVNGDTAEVAFRGGRDVADINDLHREVTL